MFARRLVVSATEVVVDKSTVVLSCSTDHRLTEEDLRKALAAGETVLLVGKVGQRACKKYLEGNCTNPSYDYWHPPVFQKKKKNKSESGCNFGDECLFRHTEADRQPCKRSQRKVVGKDQLLYVKESKQTELCVPKKSFPLKSDKIGSTCTVTFSQGTWHRIKIRERKGPSEGVLRKCEPQDGNPFAPTFGA